MEPSLLKQFSSKGSVEAWSISERILFSFLVLAKIFKSESVLIKSFVSFSTSKWQQGPRSNDIFNFLRNEMTLPTATRSSTATSSLKSCDGNCRERMHLTMAGCKIIFAVFAQTVMMMLKSECKWSGPEASKTLTALFWSSGTPCVMNRPEQLTSLSLNPIEVMTWSGSGLFHFHYK